MCFPVMFKYKMQNANAIRYLLQRWDELLASKAQSWVDKCQFGKQPGLSHPKYDYVGEVFLAGPCKAYSSLLWAWENIDPQFQGEKACPLQCNKLLSQNDNYLIIALQRTCFIMIYFIWYIIPFDILYRLIYYIIRKWSVNITLFVLKRTNYWTFL